MLPTALRVLPVLLLLGHFLPGRAAEVVRVDFLMLSDPEIPDIRSAKTYDSRCIPLWSQALKRPEHDYQRLAAETVARAHEVGMPGLDVLKLDLRSLLAAPTSTPPTRYAAAHALIALQDRASAELLLEQSRAGNLLLRQLVEPALADWNDEAARAVWHDRLGRADTPRQDLLLAIRGLGRVADAAALPQLLEVVHDARRLVEFRLAAAQASGRIASADLEPHVDRLLANPDLPRRLCAISLLARHTSAAAVQQLQRLGAEPEPSVAWQALARLRQIDPALVLPLAEYAMRHADANVRREGIDTYLTLPTPERIAFVGRLLDDPHPALRGRIRDELVVLAKQPDLDGPIREVSRQVLAGDSWRGQEQALLVLATLNDEPSAPRALELLKSPRDEVLVTAAWTLRKLAVSDTLPAVHEFVAAATARRKGSAFPHSKDAQIAHLCELLGLLRHRPADALLQQYIPLKPEMGDLSRPAAIWALGKLREGEFDESLAEKLIDRILAISTFPPETSEVKQMSAISLARLKATSTVERMKGYMGPTVSPNRESLALRWSLIALTGKDIPLPEAVVVTTGGWFLEPAVTAPAAK